jgi:hypothetical protein
MNVESILNYVMPFVSDFNFIISMLIIVMIAACFLGRYVVITRKMFIVTLGVVVLQVLLILTVNLVIKQMNPDFYKLLDEAKGNVYLSADDPNYEFANRYSTITSLIFNGIIFTYAFIFFLVANKEKKFIRAVESEICLCLYYFYINSMLNYALFYLHGGDTEFLMTVVENLYSKEYFYFTTMMVTSQFVLMLAMLLIIYFRFYKKKKYYTIRVRDRILFVVWQVIFYVFPAIPYWFESIEVKYKALSMVFAVLILIVGIVAPVIIIMLAAEKNLKEKNEYQETYLAAELEYIERYKNAQTETRAFRHDIINNLSVVKMTLEENRSEEALEHINQLLGNVKALSPSIITGDEMLDCIVSMKADKMKEMSIDFKTDGVVDGGLHMKPMDVCSIFANALDNAIEASSKTGDKAWVDLNIKRNEKFFIIKIANSALQKVDVEKLFTTSGYTSKEDKEHHGFGLRNIRNTVEENEGLLKAESGDDYFALSIMISR